MEDRSRRRARLVLIVGFLFALLYAPTRRLVLVLGVLLHVGMLFTMEIGPFGWVMLASYTSFIDPALVPMLPRRLVALVSNRIGTAADRGVPQTLP